MTKKMQNVCIFVLQIMQYVCKCYFSKLIFIPCWKWTQTEDRCEVVLTLIQDDNKYKHQVNLWGHDTCSLSVIAMDHHPPRPSAPLQPCDHLCGWIPALCCKWEVTFQHLCACSCDDAIPQKKKEKRKKTPRCSPGSTDIVLLPVSSNSSGLLGPVRKAFLHTAPQVPANRGPVKQMPRDGLQPISDTHNCSLPGGKVHSQSMDVSIFNLFCWEKKEESKAATFATVP